MTRTTTLYKDWKHGYVHGTMIDTADSTPSINTGLPSVGVYLITDQTCPERALNFDDNYLPTGWIVISNYTTSDILHFRAWEGDTRGNQGKITSKQGAEP
jgi:hypothetical protein